MADKPDKVVTLTLNANGLAVPDQDPIVIKKSEQQIRWCAGFEFTIDIEDYSDVKYSAGGATDCAFSARTGKFDTEKRYKYSITANGKVNDPDIDLKP